MISLKYLLFATIVTVLWNHVPPTEAGLRKWIVDYIFIPASRVYRQIRIGFAKLYKINSFYLTGCVAEKLFLYDRIAPTSNDASKSSNEKLCENLDEEVLKARCVDVFRNKYFDKKMLWSFNGNKSPECVTVDVYSSKHRITYRTLKVLLCPAKLKTKSGTAGAKKSAKDAKEDKKLDAQTEASADGKEEKKASLVEEDSATFNTYIASALNKYKDKTQYYLLMEGAARGKGLEKSSTNSGKKEKETEPRLTLQVKALLFNLKMNGDTKKEDGKGKANGGMKKVTTSSFTIKQV